MYLFFVIYPLVKLAKKWTSLHRLAHLSEILSAAVGLRHLAHGWIAVQMLHV